MSMTVADLCARHIGRQIKLPDVEDHAARTDILEGFEACSTYSYLHFNGHDCPNNSWPNLACVDCHDDDEWCYDNATPVEVLP